MGHDQRETQHHAPSPFPRRIARKPLAASLAVAALVDGAWHATATTDYGGSVAGTCTFTGTRLRLIGWHGKARHRARTR
ncbi:MULTISPECIES: hypothetical protein [unclassified Streptomyces]|uniref:hypothetical protein n=1 Tax=unclassified Streptomyces TaxID=2593676 RepID=UPI00403CF4C3